MKAKTIRRTALILIGAVILSGCSKNTEALAQAQAKDSAAQLKYEVDPKTFALSVTEGEQKIPVANPLPQKNVADLVRQDQNTSWRYPDEQIAVSVSPTDQYLEVTVKSEAAADNEFRWPDISGDTYYLPLGEGKRIPADNQDWKNYLDQTELNVMEQLSMPFWAARYGDYAVLYIMEDPYRSDLSFTADPAVRFSLNHSYPEIDSDKENHFRIYVTKDDPVEIAKTYQQYVKEKGDFVTLEEKAEQNPNVRKLYGAPHIYLWGENLIAPEDIKWPAFRAALDSDIMSYLKQLADSAENGAEALTALTEMAGQDYVAEYQKALICRYLSELLKKNDFYKPEHFPVQDETIKSLAGEKSDNTDPAALIRLNKQALALNLPEVFSPADTWMNSGTVGLITELKGAGIDQAWVGLNSWEQAYAKPELTTAAEQSGYLIGPYDSYHSIHEPGSEQWITAKFPDESLYEDATVTQQDGEKASGFQNVGRKLNPTLSLPSVKERVAGILSAPVSFNSWFIDCDATGEIYDDYTPGHLTTQQEDLQARLERMSYIRDQHDMVIGSEGGHDFAASTIAFAHGIELKSFSWMDDDMKKNKDSEYYIGGYYSPGGGVPEHFGKKIPVKDQYYSIFVDMKYDLPLYKLVYNNSVITTYHWDWSTFKIKGAEADRMLREVLYNVPPLYHLDKTEWDNYREDIVKHTKVWSAFSKAAIKQEMTDFKYLNEDGSVQSTSYGASLTVTANFSDQSYLHGNTEIPAYSLLLEQDNNQTIYTPSIS